MVLSKSMLEDAESSSPMDVEVKKLSMLFPSHLWLLEQLPSLPLFELVKMNVCNALRQVSRCVFYAM